MELKAQVQSSLQHLTEQTTFDDQLFEGIINYAIDAIIKGNIQESAQHELNGNSEAKAAFNSVVYLFLEAAKHNYEEIEFTHYLEEFTLNVDRVQYLCSKYIEVKNEIRSKVLSKKTFGFPSLVDVDWRLDYVVKSSQVEKTNEPVYTLKFKNDQGEIVTLSCTTEQLQDLYTKLRDAQKQVERSLKSEQ